MRRLIARIPTARGTKRASMVHVLPGATGALRQVPWTAKSAGTVAVKPTLRITSAAVPVLVIVRV
jgi:hypothetical protein